MWLPTKADRILLSSPIKDRQYEGAPCVSCALKEPLSGVNRKMQAETPPYGHNQLIPYFHLVFFHNFLRLVLVASGSLSLSKCYAEPVKKVKCYGDFKIGIAREKKNNIAKYDVRS